MSQDDAPVVAVDGGRLRGHANGAVASFLGVPYAAPPVGEHRLRPPAPVVGWLGERDATRHGPTAPKLPYPSPFDRLFHEVEIPGDEWLNVAVWAPADTLAAGAARPVLVWIHGGSFTNGSNSVPAYDGSAFARDGVVVVSVNYRLGAEGFAHLPPDAVNLGLQDQLAALRWVRGNVAAFGGDPARVTVAGESAGGMSVAALLALPEADGLFARAILASGAAAHAITADEAAAVTARVEALVAGPLDGVPPHELAAASAGLVREVRADVTGATWGRLPRNLLPFAPVLDERQTVRTDVPVLVASNRDEYRAFLVPPGLLDGIDDAALTAIASRYDVPGGGLEVYRAALPGASPGDLAAAVATDWFYAIPAIRLAETCAHAWRYRFERPEPASNGGLGACHAADVPFVFDTLGREGTAGLVGPDPDAAVAATAHRIWVDFVTDGEPGWPTHGPERTTALVSDAITVVADPDAERRQVWDGIR